MIERQPDGGTPVTMLTGSASDVSTLQPAPGTGAVFAPAPAGGHRRSSRGQDRALLDAMSSGDAVAVASVLRSCRQTVRAVATRRGLDPASVDDVAQEVAVALWASPQRWDPARGPLGAYVTTLAKHRTIDLLRSQSSRRAREAQNVEQAPDTLDVETQVVRTAEGEAIRAALSRLPEHQRRPIVLTFFGNRTYRQAAQELGLPEGTVKSQIRAGLRTLRSSVVAEPAVS